MTQLLDMRATVRALLALAIVTVPACGGEPATTPNDAATPVDAAAHDAGRDAASRDEDAATEDDAAVEEDAATEDDAAVEVDAAPDIDAAVLPHDCTTTIAATDAGTFVRLCDIDGTVEHFRIEGIAVPGGHSFAQLVFGFAEAPASGTGALTDDQMRITLYGGGPPPPALVQAELGDQEALGAVFTHDLVTVCGDVHDGDFDSAPYVVLWVDGTNGADCEDATTLTIASAFDSELAWNGPASVNKATPTFYFQSGAVTTYPTISLFDAPVLDETTLLESTQSCTTAWTADTNWQPLCTPIAGAAHHVRVEDVAITANNGYAYLILAAPAASTGTPATAAGDGRMILTMGRSHTGTSWTYFRFDGMSTTQFGYATDAAAPLYIAGPSTVCLDVGEIDGHARVVFWATGAGGADCDDWTTLTTANALYDSSTDVATGAIWDALFAVDVDFVKTNNATASIGNVVRFTEAAVL